jgi:IS5 family transposase
MGRPGISIQMMIGLHLLKHIYSLSDEIVCMRWIENPYYQYFCGETFFQFKEPIERSCLTHFRNRIDPKDLEHILQESLGTAFDIGALKLKDLRSVAVDTTVQEKAIAHPTDHGLLLKAVQRLGKAAVKVGIKLRQSYVRVVKSAAIKVGRYLHAKQKRRAKKSLKFMQVRLGRLIRDVERKAEKMKELPSLLQESLHKARRILHQKRGDKDYLYSWHATEVECIGKGKAKKPYEFGCKVSLSTQLRTKGKHFILQAQALPGKPYDGHTLEGALDQIERMVGRKSSNAFVDKGYKGHKSDTKARVVISGQKRGITEPIKRDMQRRSVIEPIIGHAKNDGLLRRNYLKGTRGDYMNAILAATGFNFRQILSHLAAV